MGKYALIVQYLKNFEQTLKDNHELWIKFPEYDCSFSLQATENGDDEFIAFDLLSETNEHFSVVQNYSQLNFAVFSKPSGTNSDKVKPVGFTAR